MTGHNESKEVQMLNSNFMKGVNAPDGVHEAVEFNEYRDAAWWEAKRRRERIVDRLAPLAALIAMLAAYAIVGQLEFMP